MTSSDLPLPPFLRPPTLPPPSSARVDALYAFTSTQRVSNPTGFTSNLAFWAAVIEYSLGSGRLGGAEESEKGDRLVLSTSGVGERLEYKGKRPKGLGSVLEDQVEKKRLYNLIAFNSAVTPILAPPSLTSRFITQPLWWALSQLNPLSSSSSSTSHPTSAPKEETLWKRYQGEYVHLPLVRKAAARFVAYMDTHPALDYTSTLYSRRSFAQTFGRICLPLSSSSTRETSDPDPKVELDSLTLRDCDVLIRWLSRDVGLIVSDPSLGIIKLLPSLDPAEKSTAVSDAHTITEADRGTVAVLDTLQKVEDQIASIEAESAKSQMKAKHHLAQNQRSVALSYLRSKKRLDDLLAKRVGAAEQLRAVIVSLNQAKGDVEIMNAYELSASILSQALSHPSLSPAHIAETTDALSDAIADQREIEEAVRFAGGIGAGGGEIDEDEIASELERMVLEEKEKEKKEKEKMEKGKGKEGEKGKQSEKEAKSDKGEVEKSDPEKEKEGKSKESKAEVDEEPEAQSETKASVEAESASQPQREVVPA